MFQFINFQMPLTKKKIVLLLINQFIYQEKFLKFKYKGHNVKNSRVVFQ